MRLAILSLSLLFIGACSSQKKLSERPLSFSDAYYQLVVGGTEEAGANVVYYFNLPDADTQLDSLSVKGLGTLKIESKKTGTYTSGSTPMPPAKLEALQVQQVLLFYHKGEKSYKMTIESLPEKESIFMPSAGGPQESQ